MRIVDIRERTFPISSPIRNAVIDFSRMTLSVVAVVTDVVREGRPVVGYGFHSNGRYGQGAMLRERFIPRVLEADPESLLDENGDLDPGRVWAAAMRNEKPGGHGERSVAVGTLDMAVWDATAKLAELPLFQLLADRHGDGHVDRSVFVYAAGGYYYPDKNLQALTEEMRTYLDLGYSVVKMKIGGAPLAEDLRRIEAVLGVLGPGQGLAVDANGRFDRADALACAQALSAYDLAWFEEPVDPLDYALHAEVAQVYPGTIATGENLFSMQDARNLLRHGGLRPDRDVLQFDCALSYGAVEYLRTLASSPSTAGPRAGASRTAGTRCRWPWRRDWDWAATSPTRGCSSRSAVSPTGSPFPRAMWWSPSCPVSDLRARPTSTACSAS
jgi:L-alanine-DL-glutamate epimerase-like enolase superfamily enzyme